MRTLEEYLDLPYKIVLQKDDEGSWIAHVEELEGCAAHGDTRESALQRLDEAKGLWIRESIARNLPVPEPTPDDDLPSGKWLQRVPRSLHKKLSHLAKREGTSLNQLVTAILSGYLGSRTSTRWAEIVQSVSIGYGGRHDSFSSHVLVNPPWQPASSEHFSTTLHGRFDPELVRSNNDG